MHTVYSPPETDFRYTFTVFTPTFNRRHTLHRVYRSLLQQTFRDFEWLIVDDGSTDDTEGVVAGWKEQARFPIRYFRQTNSGKPAATNRGARLADGRLFTVLDSDDACVPEALERLKHHWDSIPPSRKAEFVGVCGLVRRPDGSLDGDPFPRSPFDSTPLELRRHAKSGERWGFMRTDLMRSYPFPLIPREKFMPESVVWNRIAHNYLTRFVNEVYRVYYPPKEGLSSRRTRVRNPLGMILYYRELAEAKTALRQIDLWRAWVNLVRYGLHAGEDLTDQFRMASSKARWLAGLGAGMAFYYWDRCRLRLHRRVGDGTAGS